MKPRARSVNPRTKDGSGDFDLKCLLTCPMKTFFSYVEY
jgi:hypothetical protein